MQSILSLDATPLHNIFEGVQMIVTSLVALRAFFLYKKSHRRRVFTLGLSMGFFALTSLASLIGDNHLMGTLNTNWFKYIGQGICLLFIFLSNLRDSDEYLQRAMNLQIMVSIGLLLFLLVTPALPNFPNGMTQAMISGSRAVICLLILCQYISFFLRKQTSFIMLMCFAFLLLTVGYTAILTKYVLPNQDAISNEEILYASLALWSYSLHTSCRSVPSLQDHDPASQKKEATLRETTQCPLLCS